MVQLNLTLIPQLRRLFVALQILIAMPIAIQLLVGSLPCAAETSKQDDASTLGATKRPRKAKPASEAGLSARSQRSLELNEQGASAIVGRDFSRAESLFRDALAADPMNLTAAFNLAGILITNKNEKEAVTLLSSYTEKFPDDAGLLARLGDAYFGSQDLKNAELQYKSALKKDATLAGIPSKLGTIFSLKGDIKSAAEMYESALKQSPKDPQILSNLSSLYVALSKPKQAVATAKIALQVAPSADLYITLGNAYLDLKENENALHAFERAATMGRSENELTKQIDELRASLKAQ